MSRDGCEFCHGLRGGVAGNENSIGGVIACDYCTTIVRRALSAAEARADRLEKALREAYELKRKLMPGLMLATCTEGQKEAWRRAMGMSVDEQRWLIQLLNKIEDFRALAGGESPTPTETTIQEITQEEALDILTKLRPKRN